jgi:hypothetical protein
MRCSVHQSFLGEVSDWNVLYRDYEEKQASLNFRTKVALKRMCVLDPAYVSAPTAIKIVGCRQKSVGKWVVD